MAQGLVIEDHAAGASLAGETLESIGLAVTIASTGDEGIRLASQRQFAVILVDACLPDTDGIEVCRALRQRDVDTPILVVSSQHSDSAEIEALELGADDYLRSPYSAPVLAARVHALIRRQRSLDQTTSYAGVSYNAASGEATAGNIKVSLTPREGQVIVVLLGSRGAPVSKRRLLEAVWGKDFDGSPNVVDVYIRYLRLKLGSERIETLSRIGYRLVSLDPKPPTP